MRKIILGALVAAPLALSASPASATVHTDPCPGAHVQVWSEVGNSGAGQATNHFVCGIPGAPGPQGPKGDGGPRGPKGEDSTVPGPKGDPGSDGADGTNGTDGVDGLPGLPGAPGVNGVDGKDGAEGPKGDEGVAGENGGPGRPGLRGVEGRAGKDGITKTIIVHADGTEEVVEALPKTGGGDSWALGLAGLGVLAGGTALVWAYRRRS